MKIGINRKLAAVAIAILVILVPAGVHISADSAGSWSVMDSGTTTDLYGIWGSSNTNVFAVGKAGTILHYDDSWSAAAGEHSRPVLNLGQQQYQYLAVGNRAPFCIMTHFMVCFIAMSTAELKQQHRCFAGQSGNIVHYDGTVRSLLPAHHSQPLRSGVQ